MIQWDVGRTALDYIIEETDQSINHKSTPQRESKKKIHTKMYKRYGTCCLITDATGTILVRENETKTDAKFRTL